ncbi:MAG: MOSC domain-containing protein [Actinomycetota bacterium]
MDGVTEATVDEEGIVGNADRGGRRQVTLISAEAWAAACDVLGEDVDPVTRRANLLVSGVDLEDTRSRLVRVGEVALEVTTETVPCRLMDFFHEGLMGALKPEWRGGVSARVVTPGLIRIGDPVHLA